MTEQRLVDADARRRIEEDLGSTLVVEAAAGTGKTTALVGRLLSLLTTGRGTLEGVVAVTFTERAAGEMKLRLRSEIERTRLETTDQAVVARLDRAIAELEAARINTIHAFCADLLRERPVEAGIDPGFEIVTEDQADQMLVRAFEEWLEEALSQPGEGLRRILRQSDGQRGVRPRLLSACRTLIEHRDFACVWRRPTFNLAHDVAPIIQRLQQVSTVARRSRSAKDRLADDLREIARVVGELDARDAVRGTVDHDGWEAACHGLLRKRIWKRKGHGRDFVQGLPREDVLALRAQLEAELERFVEHSEADLAALLFEELRPIVTRYDALKQRAGGLDFLDLMIRTRDLLVARPDVRVDLASRFTHLFVDEFQDTDPLQADILLLLAADDPGCVEPSSARPVAGKLFVVGDPKQSIYRFRRADVAVYERVKAQLIEAGAEVLYLVTSFRSVPAIQAAVNQAFEIAMAPVAEAEMPTWAGIQAAYVPLAPHRAARADFPSLVALPVPEPYSQWGQLTARAVSESTPASVAAFIDWLVRESGLTVELDGARAPVETRHVCLLFRRFRAYGDDVTRAYVRSLESRRLPHVLVGGRSFHHREEVMALKAALRAVEWPDDELSIYATLRGPFFSFTDDVLLGYRHRGGKLHPMAPPLDDPGEVTEYREIEGALALMRSLHTERNRRPFGDTIQDLVAKTRAHAGIAIWPTGEQALANVLRLVHQARRFDSRFATSFRSFVEWLDEEEEKGAGEAPIVEEGTEGVRIMTVHAAKGLEFPVVILADPTAPRSARRPSQLLDPGARSWAAPLAGCVPIELAERAEEVCRRDEAEEIRIAYVAATRARDMLVVPVVGDEPIKGWVDVLHPALYPGEGQRRNAVPAPGCPDFGGDSVLRRPLELLEREHTSVRPGLHEQAAGGHGVVFWDPHVFDLRERLLGGLRQQEILVGDESTSRSDVSLAQAERWAHEKADAIARAGVPSHEAHTVTELASAALDSGAALVAPRGEGAQVPPLAGPLAGTKAKTVQYERVPRRASDRPRGKRFGVLVHGMLEHVPFDAPPIAIAALGSSQGRVLGASEREVEAAVDVVTHALRHPLMVAASASDEAHREWPIIIAREDGSSVEGVVDLCFRRGHEWTVVDFKTDASGLEGDDGAAADRRTIYEAQVRLYAETVEAATGAPVQAVLFVV